MLNCYWLEDFICWEKREWIPPGIHFSVGLERQKKNLSAEQMRLKNRHHTYSVSLVKWDRSSIHCRKASTTYEGSIYWSLLWSTAFKPLAENTKTYKKCCWNSQSLFTSGRFRYETNCWNKMLVGGSIKYDSCSSGNCREGPGHHSSHPWGLKVPSCSPMPGGFPVPCMGWELSEATGEVWC